MRFHKINKGSGNYRITAKKREIIVSVTVVLVQKAAGICG